MYLCDVCSNDGNLGENIEAIIDPTWEKESTGLRKIEARDRTKLDAEGLEEYGKEIGQKHHKQQFILICGSSSHASGIVSRVNYDFRYQQSILRALTREEKEPVSYYRRQQS